MGFCERFVNTFFHVPICNQRRILRETSHSIFFHPYVFTRWFMYSLLRARIDVFLLHFKQSNERRTTGREFSASSPLKAGSERIFLAFPLAARVTRLRLKYLLVDFTTMGSCHHRRLSSTPILPPFHLPSTDSSRDFFYRSIYISRARKIHLLLKCLTWLFCLSSKSISIFH